MFVRVSNSTSSTTSTSKSDGLLEVSPYSLLAPSTPFWWSTLFLISPNQNESTECGEEDEAAETVNNIARTLQRAIPKKFCLFKPTFLFLLLIKWNSGVLSHFTPSLHWLPQNVFNKLKSVFSLSPILHFIIISDYTNCKQHFATLSPPHQNSTKTPVEKNSSNRRTKMDTLSN